MEGVVEGRRERHGVWYHIAHSTPSHTHTHTHTHAHARTHTHTHTSHHLGIGLVQVNVLANLLPQVLEGANTASETHSREVWGAGDSVTKCGAVSGNKVDDSCGRNRQEVGATEQVLEGAGRQHLALWSGVRCAA